jgi:hypothetical protein
MTKTPGGMLREVLIPAEGVKDRIPELSLTTGPIRRRNAEPMRYSFQSKGTGISTGREENRQV